MIYFYKDIEIEVYEAIDGFYAKWWGTYDGVSVTDSCQRFTSMAKESEKQAAQTAEGVIDYYKVRPCEKPVLDRGELEGRGIMRG